MLPALAGSVTPVRLAPPVAAAPTTPLGVDCAALLNAVGARALASAEENVVAAVEGVAVELEVDAAVLAAVAFGRANADCSPDISVLICVTRASASV
jgi:NADH:ubiquinone oxidoreductase subunit K